MKTTDVKRSFVQLRAEGLSYTAIAGKLHISKATCCKWDRTMASEIGEARREEMAALAEQYAMTRAARIRSLGETLKKVDAALAGADFSGLPPDKLLAMKLKLTEAVRAEGVDRPRPQLLDYEVLSEETILSEYCELLDRVRSGENVDVRVEAQLLADVHDAFKAAKSERSHIRFMRQLAASRGEEYDDAEE